MIAVSIAFFGVVLCSAFAHIFSFKKSLNEEALSVSNTHALRGLLAVSIFLSHLWSHVLHPVSIMSYMGSIGVGTFFFLSGYALTVSAWQRPHYFDGFIRKRLTRVGVPYVLFLLIYTVTTILLCKNSLNNILTQFMRGNPPSNSWYIWLITGLYFVFYFLYRNSSIAAGKPEKKKNLVLLVLLLSYMIICRHVLHLFDWWYKTVIMFLVGCIIAQYQQEFEDYLQKYFLPNIIVTTVLLLISLSFPAVCNRIGAAECLDVWFVQDTMLGIFGTAFVVLSCFKIEWSNAVSMFLGDISLEIYLVHGLMIEVFRHYLGDSMGEIPVVLLMICVLTAALSFHKLTEYLFKQIR